MRFPVKSKLAFGVTFLFVCILVIGILAIFFIYRLSNNTDAILKDNYNTLLYCNNMLKDIDTIKDNPKAINDFETNLKAQEGNITEPGEAQATQQLRFDFSQIKINNSDIAFYEDARKQICRINELNQKAIEKKNTIAQETSGNAILWLSLIVTFLFLTTFSFVINFPGWIANPIKLLTEGIKEVANKNYDKRIYFQSSDEFGELADAFNQMASKLHEYEHSNLAKLMFEKKRIETIIGQMNDAVIGLDAQKNILFVNSIAESLLNLKADEAVGKYSADVALKNDLLRNLLVKEEKNVPVKIVIDGKENFFTKEYKNVMNNNEIIGEVIALKNITQFKELDVSKTNFIATISHELKTPISSIQMSLKLLEDKRIGETNSEQKQLIRSVKEDSERLLKITGELLNMTQVETGKIHLSIQQADVKEIIRYAIDATKTQAEQKKVLVEVHCPEDVQTVNADTEKTAWVLTNLISNAIRYSNENSKIVVSAKSIGKKMELSVQDFGKGIDSKYTDKIFDRYFRIPGTKQEGTGLGLAIGKEFIEAQGGEIKVESEIGQGSKFIFFLNT